ncbi:MAG: hypothetical protein ACK4HT_08160 [Thermus caldifontis]
MARVHARFPSVSVGFSPAEGRELLQVLEAADGIKRALRAVNLDKHM